MHMFSVQKISALYVLYILLNNVWNCNEHSDAYRYYGDYKYSC